MRQLTPDQISYISQRVAAVVSILLGDIANAPVKLTIEDTHAHITNTGQLEITVDLSDMVE